MVVSKKCLTLTPETGICFPNLISSFSHKPLSIEVEDQKQSYVPFWSLRDEELYFNFITIITLFLHCNSFLTLKC